MTLKYLCDYEDCHEEIPSEELFYVRVPPRVDDTIRVKRFCCIDHFHSWVHALWKSGEGRG
jgi:hypothetical protein